MKVAVTISLVPQARGGPFVFWDSLADSAAKAAELGFQAVELFPPSAEAVRPDDLRALLDRHRLKLAAVGTGPGWVLHKLTLTDSDATVRARALKFIEGIVDFAARFGAPAIIGSMQGRAQGDVDRGQAMAWLREALDQIGLHAQGAGVPLLFEPLNRYETNLVNTVSHALDLLRPLRAPNVKILTDLFHMNIEEASIADALRQAGGYLGHVHLADSNRHAAGFGHTDFAPIAKALSEAKYQGCLSAEVFPLPDSISAAKRTMQTFREFFDRA